MKKANQNCQPDASDNPSGFNRAKPRINFAYLVIYGLYIGIVMVVAARLGAFQWKSSQATHKRLVLPHISVALPNNLPATINELPQGNLAFDKEVKQATIHEGDAQAHFVFNLTNISRQPVTINAVNTSCGCTVAQLPQVPWTLKSGENGQIQVTVNVPDNIPATRKDVTVVTSLGVRTLIVEATRLMATNLPVASLH